MDTAIIFWLSFLAGIYAPIGSPCVITLYPGYISFLAGRSRDAGGRFTPLALGAVVAGGILAALFSGGIIFGTLVQAGGGSVRNILSPVVFIVLLLFSLFLIFDIDYGRIRKTIPVPRVENPVFAALLLGLAFGIIILPCNAASLIVLLGLAAATSGFFEGAGAFLCFGIGMILPIIIIAGITEAGNQKIMTYLTGNRRLIQGIAGLSMLVISVWYLALFFFPQYFL